MKRTSDTKGRFLMSFDISSVSAVSPVENIAALSGQSAQASHSSAAKTPPPPPPPPPIEDTVKLTLAASVAKLESEGDSPIEISQALGVPLQTVSIDLESSVIEAALAAAPTIPIPNPAITG